MNNLSSLLGYVDIPKELFLNTHGNWFLVPSPNGRCLGVPKIKDVDGKFMFNMKILSVYEIEDVFYKMFLETILSSKDSFHRKTKNPVCFFKESSLNQNDEGVTHNIDESFIPSCRTSIVQESMKEVILRPIVHFFYRRIKDDFLRENYKCIENTLKGMDFKKEAMKTLKDYGPNPKDYHFKEFTQLNYSFLKILKKNKSLLKKVQKAEKLLLTGNFMDGVYLVKEIHKEVINQTEALP